MRLLVTRPEPDATRQARQLEAKGHEVVVEPLLEIAYPERLDLPFDEAQALIVTSRNGLRALRRAGFPESALDLPVLAVGESSADLAREMGFGQVHEGRGTAADLVAVAETHCAPSSRPLLHLAGANLTSHLKPALVRRGFEVLQPAVYEAVAARRLGDAVQQEIRERRLHGIVFMSPRTAAIFLELLAVHGLELEARSIPCFCLSNAVGAKLAAFGFGHVAICGRPREDELLALIPGRPADCA